MSLPPIPGAGASAAALTELGRALSRLGLNERAVRACFGVRCVGHAPLRAAAQGARPVPTPAAVVPWLFVAGRQVPLAAARARLGDALDSLAKWGFVSVTADQVTAEVSILPLGNGLCVTDRHDARDSDRVTVPDDSAFHLVGVLPATRVGRWLDVGTGSGIALLAAAGCAERCRGTDVHERSLDMARLGVGLTGAGAVTIASGDLLASSAPRSWDLITFNAPIPDAAGAGTADSAYRSTGGRDRLLDEFWAQAREALAPDGELLVHSWLPPGRWRDHTLPGALSIARYTPPGHTVAFGITRWRPGEADRQREIQVTLTEDQPHVARAHLADAAT